MKWQKISLLLKYFTLLPVLKPNVFHLRILLQRPYPGTICELEMILSDACCVSCVTQEDFKKKLLLWKQ